MKNIKFFKLTKTVINKSIHDEVMALGAQLTYYVLLSFFPFLIFLITLASYTPITNEDAIRSLGQYLPNDIYAMVSDTIHQTINSRSGALLSLGMIATIWSASNGISALIRGLNKAYEHKETRPFWKIKSLSIMFTFLLAIIFISSIIMLVLGEIIARNLFSFLGLSEFFYTLWRYTRYLFPSITMVFIFSIFYRFIPNRRLTWKGVIPGAIFSSIGWITISVFFSYYINNIASLSRMYGSIGSVIALLIWMYWSSIIILLGGQLNAVLYLSKKVSNI